MLRSDGIVIARSHRASNDARPSTGYGDAAIQERQGALFPLDCFASLAMTISIRRDCNFRQARLGGAR